MKVYPPGPSESEEHWFAEMASPHGWLMTADNLFEQCVGQYRHKGRGYLTLKDRHGRQLRWDTVDRSLFLLGGFALENAIKAFLVYENPQFVANGMLARQLRSHRLVKLKRVSKTIPMPARSEAIIQVFEEAIETWSRYPSGLTANQTDHQRWFTPELWNSYCGLMRRYGLKLRSHLEKGWNGPHGSGGKWTFGPEPFLDAKFVRD
jgi:hypothetical protein